MKTIQHLAIPLLAVLTVGLLAGCQGGAQSSNPVAKVPGSSESADTTTSGCKPASRSTVAQLNGQIDTGTKIQLADIAESDGVWYVAASTSGDERSSSGHVTVGVWGTATDPTASTFSGTLTPVNAQARDAQTDPAATSTAAPTSSSTAFDAGSAAAQKARKCMIQDSGLYQ